MGASERTAATVRNPAIYSCCRYPVRQAVRHAVAEHFRCATFRALLQGGRPGPAAAAALGQLMFQSHASNRHAPVETLSFAQIRFTFLAGEL